MNRKTLSNPLIGAIFKKVAPKIGAKVIIEPEWGVAGQIIYRSGRIRYFRNTSIDLNTLGASEIAKDKDYANFFMRRLGYTTIPGKTFFRDSWAMKIRSARTIGAACVYAQKFGYPVIVKPNSGSQGRAVELVHSEKGLIVALKRVFKIDRVALVQRRVVGFDYRVVVLDDQVISAYQRIPLSVVGDGRSTIGELLEKKQRIFKREGRDTELSYSDPRISSKLAKSRLKLSSVVPRGVHISLLDNANLSTGGDSVDVTTTLHDDIQKLAIRLTKDMGLRLCGVDLMIPGDIAAPLKEYHILEINAAPGLDHYATSGRAQQKIVEDLYLEVLRHMEHA